MSAISLVPRTREITDIFNTFDEICLVFISKKVNILSIYIFVIAVDGIVLVVFDKKLRQNISTPKFGLFVPMQTEKTHISQCIRQLIPEKHTDKIIKTIRFQCFRTL